MTSPSATSARQGRPAAAAPAAEAELAVKANPSEADASRPAFEGETGMHRLALAELHQRKASVDSAVAAGFYPREQGERLLRCWLSIALAAGARPGDCSALLGMWAEDHGFDDRHARIVLLDEGPPRAEWLAELARARDTAGGKARAASSSAAVGQTENTPTDMKLATRHHALDSLCIFLGGPSERPVEPELEAA